MNRNGQNIGAYTNIVKDSNYYFDMIINSVPNGEYTMFVEVEDNSGKKYCINLDFKNIQNKIINENGVNRTLRLTDDKRIDIYNGNISGTNYYFDMIINNLEGEYTIYVEAKADDRKYI